jgi:hypothetical protein
MTRRRTHTSSPGYQVFMLAMCLYALGELAVQSTVSLSPATRTILDYSDYAVCGVFVVDFVVSLVS